MRTEKESSSETVNRDVRQRKNIQRHATPVDAASNAREIVARRWSARLTRRQEPGAMRRLPKSRCEAPRTAAEHITRLMRGLEPG